jgi:hypothetical protein
MGTGFEMAFATAKMAKKTAQKNDASNSADYGTALDRCYGQIGISAVAAAVRYQGVGKNPAYAPVANRRDLRIEEAA